MVWELVSFATILALGSILRLYDLVRNGYGNPYYSAGVLSMTRSLHNFFFNAFDPAGVLAVDKPPLALWVQVASAKLFGFAPLSVLAPQAVEGMISVAVVWHLVRRRFGRVPGLLAALLLAITPISVAVDRSSNTDSCLVMVLLLAAWALLAAAERENWRLLLVAMALVGVGFNVKMMAAFVVLPGFALTYLVAPAGTGALNRGRYTRRLLHLAMGGALCFGVAFAWTAAVELTPASERPFVDSSPTNSMLDLIVDHNGVQRFLSRSEATLERPAAARDRVPAGPLRLVDPRLATQVAWLMPLALIGGVVALIDLPWAAPASAGLTLWLGWLLAYGIVYSAAGGLFSAYYLVTLAPPLAALAAVGSVSLWMRWREGRSGWWLLPATLMLTAGWQVWLVVPSSEIGGTIDAVTAAQSGRWWLALGVLGSLAAALLGLVLAPRPTEAKGALAFGLLALLAAPAVWTAETAFAETQGARPVAALGPLPVEPWRDNTVADAGLAKFLRTNAAGTRFLAATVTARQAAPLIIATGEPVLAMGGFIGNLPVVTLPILQDLVGSGQVRFVLLDEEAQSPGTRRSRGGPRRTQDQAAIMAWVEERGKPVDPALWHPVDAVAADGRRPMAARLYDLSGRTE